MSNNIKWKAIYAETSPTPCHIIIEGDGLTQLDMEIATNIVLSLLFLGCCTKNQPYSYMGFHKHFFLV